MRTLGLRSAILNYRISLRPPACARPFREIFLVATALVLTDILPIVTSTADAELSLRPSILALIQKFSTTVSPPLSQKRLASVLVSVVGCPRDGQVGPLDAPHYHGGLGRFFRLTSLSFVANVSAKACGPSRPLGRDQNRDLFPS